MSYPILYPMFALALLTFGVALWMARLRFAAVQRGDLSADYYRLNRGGEPPEYLAKVSQNFDNLLELPILFYVGCLLVHVTGKVDGIYLAMAWTYVATRVLHSWIHTTYNDVMHRMVPFGLGTLVLIAMWLRLLFQL